MEGLADNLSKPEKLAVAILDYKDVFSSGPEDMGQTHLVMHSIDMGEHHSIRLSPRLLPITNQDVEKAEIQNMLDRDIMLKQLG